MQTIDLEELPLQECGCRDAQVIAKWKLVKCTNGPSPRGGHSMTLIEDRFQDHEANTTLFMFGGSNRDGNFSHEVRMNSF
jgi:hypothetical protein